jgi:glutamate-ammonia-ligase adenylyltransferase
MATFADRKRARRILESWNSPQVEACILAFEMAADPDRALDEFARWSRGSEAELAADVRVLGTFSALLDSDLRSTLLYMSPEEFLAATPEIVPSFGSAREAFRRLEDHPDENAVQTLLLRMALCFHIAALRGSWTVRLAEEAISNANRAAREVAEAQGSTKMGYPLQVQLDPRLDELRRRIRELHAKTLTGFEVDLDDRARVGAALGVHSAAGLRLIDALPNSEGAFAALCTNEEALHRLTTILESAPALIGNLRDSESLTVQLLEKGFEAPKFLRDVPLSVPPPALAAQFSLEVTRTKLAWAIEPSFSLGEALTSAYDAILKHICGRLCLGLDLIALGSYGSRELSLASDLDVLVMASSADLGARDQLAALLAFVAGLARHGLVLNLDIGLESESARLRPGTPVIWTYEGFGDYELESMSLMERFNLGNTRQIWGDGEAQRIVRKTAYALPLTPERLRDLVSQKKMAEGSIRPQHRRRDVKRGLGGLTDIEWFVHLHEMRFPTATRAGSTVELDDRVASLSSTRLINSVERDELLEARKHLREVRHRLSLLGFSDDVIPENPDKLARVAAVFGYADGNDFLAYHERVIDTVRGIYVEGLERLKA